MDALRSAVEFDPFGYFDDGTIATPKPPQPDKPERTVEIVRSVSFKLNLGNYQSMDFFCSQKAQCLEGDRDSTSADLYAWCFEQVMDSVREVRRRQAEKEAAQQGKR